jgi:hypothetical protein
LHLIERHVGFAAFVVKPLGVFGARPSSARIALLVWLRARSSITCPRRTRATITAAGSKYTSICPPLHETTLEIPGERQ